MPLVQFTYECRVCPRRWPEQRDRNDPNLNHSLITCSDAGHGKGRRVFDPGYVGVTYKGDGWARRK